MFQLSAEEKGKVVAICDHLRRLKFTKSNSYAFTEHGALMAEPERKRKPIGFGAREKAGGYSHRGRTAKRER